MPDFTLNHAIATYYKDGCVTIGDHQDDIAPGSLIFDVSLARPWSLGASRWFYLTSNDNTRRQDSPAARLTPCAFAGAAAFGFCFISFLTEAAAGT